MEYDNKKWKVYTWKNGQMLHWILNPGLAINELILGQRVPKVMLEDKESDKPRLERSYVPCPHCNTLHDGRTWSAQNKTAFQNWYGLYCNNCGEVIPCLRNSLSRVLLILTYPIWIWFNASFKKQWLEKQPLRFQNLDIESTVNPYEGYGWLRQGLYYAVFMYITMVFLFPKLWGDEITQQTILIGIPVWLIAGVVFGYTMKFIMNQKGNTGKTRSTKMDA